MFPPFSYGFPSEVTLKSPQTTAIFQQRSRACEGTGSFASAVITFTATRSASGDAGWGLVAYPS
jgi:hypothetical protein